MLSSTSGKYGGAGGVRKRARSPPGPAYVADYRPYTGGQLRRVAEGRTREDHRGHWDLYYRNNTVNGYRDRHYILREFVELREAIEHARAASNELAHSPHGAPASSAEEKPTNPTLGHSPLSSTITAAAASSFAWMEAGCGVGNAMLPIFEAQGDLPQWRALLGFDISAVAVALLQEKVSALEPALAAKVHICALDPCERDVADCPFFEHAATTTDTSSDTRESQQPLTTAPPSQLLRVPTNLVEFVSMIFVLCSIPVSKHTLVLRRITACMRRPGGCFFFRDYAVTDHAADRFQQRARAVAVFPASASIAENREDDACSSNADEDFAGVDHGTTYARTNGTLSHFFSLAEVRALMASVGFTEVELKVVGREVRNRKTGAVLSRKFVQGRFRLD